MSFFKNTLLGGLIATQAIAAPILRDGRFDSAEAAGFDGVVGNAYLLSTQQTEAAYREEIIAQLFYFVGLLNTYQAAADLGHAKIDIISVKKLEGSDLSRVDYSVKVLVGWPKKTQAPDGLVVALPSRVDEEGIKEFYGKYRKTCSEDPQDSDLSAESFYYYYRPYNDACPLMQTESQDAMKAALVLKTSAENTEGKAPEYTKVWEDGKLVITTIFGTNHEGASSNKDAGIAAYNNMYRGLMNFFGRPRSMRPQLKPNAQPGMRYPDVEMEWRLSDGRVVNANILMIDKMALQDPTPQFAVRYNQRTVASDYVSYNGHSGFGENIRALAKMGKFVAGQYQLYFVNGCDTFFYVDDSLRVAHADVNPGSTPYQFFDIITNAMPSPFAAEARNNMAVVQAMVERRKTYREILSLFAPSQIAIVMGEEDNRWPQPF